jgi:type IV secretory pathway TraG/TraD family ATPase VirD4
MLGYQTPENADTSAPLYAGVEQAVLIVGPPRSGKTSSLVIPAVLDAPGAMVSTSTKPDVLYNTADFRSGVGLVWVFDPSGTIELPWWAHRLHWSPVQGCHQFDTATAMAHALASAARPGAQHSESSHWVERAEALLAPLLFAAALRGRTIGSVCQWVLGRDLREPLAVVEASGHQMALAILTGVAATDERERSGIFSTAAGLLSAYRSEAVLAAADEPNFDPKKFAQSSDSVYICVGAQEQELLAPLVVALLEQIRAGVMARPAYAAPVLFALDEVANIAPLYSLPQLASEGGGQGLVTLASMQDLSQARVRWGEAAEGFFTLFGVKVVLPGIADQRTLHLISELAGDKIIEMPSFSRPSTASYLLGGSSVGGSRTTSYMFRPRLPYDAVARGIPGYGLLINGTSFSDVRLLPWWQHSYWRRLGGIRGDYTWSQLCQLSRPDEIRSE